MNKHFISLFLIAFLMLSLNIEAQDFEVSPVQFVFNAMPGTIQTRHLTITNHSNTSSVFKLKIQDLEFDEEGNEKVLPRGAVHYSASEWLTVSPAVINIDPNSQGDISVSMSVPGDGNEARWCQIVVSEFHERTSFDADNAVAAGVILSPEIVVNVVQSPKDYHDYKFKLSDFAEIEDVEGEDRVFTIMVNNDGKSIISGQLYIIAANMDDLEEYTILKQQVTIYTHGSRKFRLELKPGTLPLGTYSFSCILDMGPKNEVHGTKLKQTVTITK